MYTNEFDYYRKQISCADSQLYYNSQFGAYFYYDAEEGQYKLHSLAETAGIEGDHMILMKYDNR